MALHIVGHDGTDRGDDAVALATRISADLRRRAARVHVIGMPPTRDRFAGPALDRLEPTAGVSGPRAARARGHAGGPARASRDVAGRGPASRLRRRGRGTRDGRLEHRGAIGRVLAGGTAERLISGAPCPVALAPGGYAGAGTSLGGSSSGTTAGRSPGSREGGRRGRAPPARAPGRRRGRAAVGDRDAHARSTCRGHRALVAEHAEQIVAEGAGGSRAEFAWRGRSCKASPDPRSRPPRRAGRGCS